MNSITTVDGRRKTTNTITAEGTPIEAFEEIRAGVAADRSQFWKDLAVPFYGANRPGSRLHGLPW